MTDTSVQTFEAFANHLVRAYRAPGVAVGVSHGGRPVSMRGFGYRDAEAGRPITPDTLFGIGSITKSFTCVAILQLAEAGKLSVDHPVVRYLPAFRTPDAEATRRMTLHHFMTHTSGLPPLPTLGHALAASMQGDPAAEGRLADFPDVAIQSYDDLMDYIAGLDFRLLGAPGEVFSYSNDAYALLGAVVERVSGEPYADYVEAHILRPAGMERSTFSPAQAAADDDATTLYAIRQTEGKDEVYPAPIWWDAPAMLAAGFLKSTTADMLRYAEIYRNGGVVGDERILSEASVERMMHPYVWCEPNRFYGYGLMITPDYGGTKLVDHGGSLKGVAAQLTVLPERGVCAVAMANLAGVPSFDIALAAVNEQIGFPVDTKRVSFAVRDTVSPAAARFAGRYESGESARVDIAVKGGRMTATLDGKVYPVQQVGEQLFVARTRE
ncbi:MAG: beta-lactamase family protein, partial [Alicyclobacillus sp.]|nr:beta-lactamase family protein [Alicyclobacillus sp.]